MSVLKNTMILTLLVAMMGAIEIADPVSGNWIGETTVQAYGHLGANDYVQTDEISVEYQMIGNGGTTETHSCAVYQAPEMDPDWYDSEDSFTFNVEGIWRVEVKHKGAAGQVKSADFETGLITLNVN